MQIKSSHLVEENRSANTPKAAAISENVDTKLEHTVPIFTVPIFTVPIFFWLLLFSSTVVLLIAALMITQGLIQHTIISASSIGVSLWPHGLFSYSGAILLLWLFIDGLLTIVVGSVLAVPFSKAGCLFVPNQAQLTENRALH